MIEVELRWADTWEVFDRFNMTHVPSIGDEIHGTHSPSGKVVRVLWFVFCADYQDEHWVVVLSCKKQWRPWWMFW